MDDLESVKQEPVEEPQDYMSYSIPLEPLKPVTVKIEPIEPNECITGYSILPPKSVTVKQETNEDQLEHNMGHHTPIATLKLMNFKQENKEVTRYKISNKSFEPSKSISVKNEIEVKSNECKMSYSLSLECIKSENVTQCDTEPLEYNMKESTDNLVTVRSANVQQETREDKVNVNSTVQLNSIKQHFNLNTDIKTNECKTYNFQKERLKQCIARISAIEKQIKTHTVEKAVNAIKKRRIRPPGEKRYECDTCDFKAARPSQLESHKRTHTGEKPHQCSMCDFKSARLSTLKQHIITHTGEKPYKCDICDFKTAHAIDLKRHIKTHTGEKPHKCNVCDYRTIRLNSLKRHIRTHTGEKPYECDMCNYKSPNDNGLRQHKRIHTGEKPYKCNLCDYKSAQSSALKKHMNKHSKEKT